MAAFGITFPKLSFCRSTTSNIDQNTISTPTTTTTRTLSLSIKNVPSQPLHYDISASTTKKKPASMATILAIDGETKQLPKNLSVFNELQLDDADQDINERRKQIETPNAVITPSSPMKTIHQYPDIQFLTNTDSKSIFNDLKDEGKFLIESRRSNHTFTPPTLSLSPNSSSNDLHIISSSHSVDLPQLKYAIEKFLLDDDEPIYEFVDEFSSGCSFIHQESHRNLSNNNITQSNINHQINDLTDNPKEVLSIHENNINDEISSYSTPVSNNIKWYVSELRIHRPLIYQTQWINEQLKIPNRKFSHSVNDLKDVYNFSNCRTNGQRQKINPIAYSTLSLQNFMNQQYHHYYSSTNTDISHSHSNEDNQYLSPLKMARTINRSVRKDDTMIRNESVKKKLFDILNDDELENACLEDMSDEFEKLSLNHPHDDLPALNSFSSSSSDDVLYSSPSNELNHLPLPMLPPLSSSYDEILSSNTNNTTDRYFGRSRLITTSLDKIPMNNHHAYDQSFSTCYLRPSYEHSRPSWYTSPLPQWRTDDQLPMVSISKDNHLENNDLTNGIISNRLFNTKVSDYNVKKNKNIQKSTYHHHHRKEQNYVNYPLINTSTSLVDNSSTIRPIIQDKSSNLLMFI